MAYERDAKTPQATKKPTWPPSMLPQTRFLLLVRLNSSYYNQGLHSLLWFPSGNVKKSAIASPGLMGRGYEVRRAVFSDLIPAVNLPTPKP